MVRRYSIAWVLLVALASCRHSGAAHRAGAAAASSGAAVGADAQAASAKSQDLPGGRGMKAARPAPVDVDRAIAQLEDRVRCNRLMGCPAFDALVARGRDAAPLVVAALRKVRRDGRAVEWLLDAARILAVHSAEPVLIEMLGASEWAARLRAALALGRAGRGEAAVTALKTAYSAERDAASRGASAWALCQLRGPPWCRRFATALAAAFGQPGAPAAVVLLPVAGELPPGKGRDLVRSLIGRALRNPNPLVRVAGARLAAALHDRASLARLGKLTGDPHPIVRKAAKAALEAIVGEGRTPASTPR